MWEITADPGQLYLVWVSQYAWTDRPCDSGSGDDCNYELTVTEGPCPVSCVAPSAWYSGSVVGTYTIDGSGFLPDNVVDGNTNLDNYNLDLGYGAHFDGRDQVWQIDVTSTSTVRFSGCHDGGYGAWNSEMFLVTCDAFIDVFDDDSCGVGGMPWFTHTLYPALSPYYLVVDGVGAASGGAYGIGMSYQ